MSVNKVILLGNLCKDPEIKTFDNGGKVAQFSMATNKRAYKTKDGREIPERVEYHNIVVNQRGLVDVAAKYLHKGDKLYIEGELRTRSYKSNDVTHYVTEVYVDTMEMLGTKAGGQREGGTGRTEPDTGVYAEDPGRDDLPF